MRLCVLFSGGKDSALSLYYAQKYESVVCLVSLVSENPESYMFHTPNIGLTGTQAEVMGLPIVSQTTPGKREAELRELRNALKEAQKRFKVQGVVTGAIASVYQASRIQLVCNSLKLECFNPLWQRDQFEVLNELIALGFKTIITGVFGEGMTKFLGRIIDKRFVTDIHKAFKEYRINPAGEGGEFESFVLYGPMFKKGLRVMKSHIEGKGLSRVMVIDEIK